MSPRERKEFTRQVTELMAPCPDIATSVGECVLQHRTCAACEDGVKFIALAIRKGITGEPLERAYKSRYDAAAVKKIPVEGSAAMGPDNAKVTIIEFADFECPHCKERMTELDALYENHKSDLRIIYKFFPLPQHPHAEVAARAAYAAGLQGKFWEMHHAIYENQTRLEQADIEKYAKRIGLDVAKLRIDMESPAAAERVNRDRKLGDDLGVQSTPALFINGREHDGLVGLEEWVARELGETPHAPDAGSASAHAPAAGSAPVAAPSAGAAKPAPRLSDKPAAK